MYTPDDTDIRLLKILQANSSFTTKELAAMINLSPTPTYERVKRLEKEGYITKYVAMLDPEKFLGGLLQYPHEAARQ